MYTSKLFWDVDYKNCFFLCVFLFLLFLLVVVIYYINRLKCYIRTNTASIENNEKLTNLPESLR